MNHLQSAPAPSTATSAGAGTPDDRWVRSAACRDADEPDIFFPGRRDSAAAALAVCDTCTVADVCLAHALETPELYGVWGGTTEEERRVRRRGRAASTARSRVSAWLDLTPRARGA